MKIKIVFYILLLYCTNSSAQDLSKSSFEFPDKLPNAYAFDAKKEFNDVKKESAKLLPKNRIDQFAEQMTAVKIRRILSGDVYIGWAEMETYLNSILNKIAPENCKKNPHVHVYPTRESEYNAYAIHDGSIFFNVSLFADVTNEAALAFILGHELSHYINKDVIKSFNKRREIAVKKEKHNDESHKSYQVELAEYSKDQERAADSLGAILAGNAGYDINFAIGSFYKFKTLTEKAYEKESSSRIVMSRKNEDALPSDSLNRVEDQVLASHPDELSRIKYFTNFIQKYNKSDAKDFLSGQQNVFNRLQEYSRTESLDILLSELDFHECASRAFTYFMLEGSDQYLYYLMESIRRCFETNKFLPGKPFMTEDLREGIFKKGQGILHNLHAHVRDTSDFKKIKPSPLTDSKNIAFETWDDAFNYFADLSIERNFSDGYLPIALRNNDTIPLRNYYLDKYLEKPGKKYSDYARAIREDKLVESLKKNSRRLVLFNDMEFTIGKGDEFKVEYFHSLESRPSYSDALNKMVTGRFTGKEYIDENELKKNNFKQFHQYDVALNSLLSAHNLLKQTLNNNSDRFKDNTVVKDNSFQELFLLNPDLWNIFKQNNIRSLHYLKAVSYQQSNSIFSFGNLNNYYSLFTCYGDILDDNRGIYYDQDQVLVFKMNKSNLLNTIYHTIKLYNEK